MSVEVDNNTNNDTPEEKLEATTVESVPEGAEQPESYQDRNWKEFRDQRKRERLEKEEAQKRAESKEAELEALKSAIEETLKPATQNQFVTEYENDEDRYRRLIREEFQAAENARKKKEAEAEALALPQTIKKIHKDFDEVVNTENIDYFEFHHPEIAKAFELMPHTVEKWDGIYKAIKKLLPTTSPKDMERKADKNLAKPGSLSGLPASQAPAPTPSVLSESARMDNWRRMQRIIKGA